MGKGIIKTILEDHRDIAIYRRAIKDIVLLLHSKTPIAIQKYDNIGEMDYIVKEITSLKSRLTELQPSKD